MQIETDDLMTVPAAAAYLRVSRQALHHAIQVGTLPALYLLGRPMLLRADVEAYRPCGYKDKRPSKRLPLAK